MSARVIYDQLLDYWPLVVLGSLFLHIIYLRNLYPLPHVPGPFLASITRLWVLTIFLGERQHWMYVDLHKKYGTQIGPDLVIVSNPKYFSEYFNWDKSEWWLAFRGHPKDIPHGNELNMELHKQKKGRIMSGYTMSQLLKNEASLDKHVMEFMNQFSQRTNTIFGLAPGTQLAAFDIAMEIVFSNPVSFVKAGANVGGLIASLHSHLSSAGTAATCPWIAKLIYHPWLFPIIDPKTD